MTCQCLWVCRPWSIGQDKLKGYIEEEESDEERRGVVCDYDLNSNAACVRLRRSDETPRRR